MPLAQRRVASFNTLLSLTVLLMSVRHVAAAEKPAPTPPALIARDAGVTSQAKLAITLDDLTRDAVIQLMPAVRTVLSTNVTVLGAITSDTEDSVQLFPEVRGHVQEIPAYLGELVEPGQPLLSYRSDVNPSEMKELTATQTGVVTALDAMVGDPIDPTAPSITLTNMSVLRCIFDVYENDIGRVQEGQRVTIRAAAYPDQVFEGRVTYISPRVDEVSRSIKVRADVKNLEGRLKFGMLMMGQIHVTERQVLAVPDTAIHEFRGAPIVFVLEDARHLVPRTVKLGARTGGLVEVQSGLREGESVVAHGGLLLKAELTKRLDEQP